MSLKACFKKAVFRAQFEKHLSCLATKFTDSVVVSQTIFHHFKRQQPHKTATSFTHSIWKSQKVSFNIASVTSYVYNLSGQKLIKNSKNGLFWQFFENLKLAVK